MNLDDCNKCGGGPCHQIHPTGDGDGVALYSTSHPRQSFWKWLKQFPWRRPKLSRSSFEVFDTSKMKVGVDPAHPDGDMTVFSFFDDQMLQGMIPAQKEIYNMYRDNLEKGTKMTMFFPRKAGRATLQKALDEITIVPSGRIDYCVECNSEHGYYCPKIGS